MKKFLYIFLIIIIGIVIFVPGNRINAALEGEGVPTIDCPADDALEGDVVDTGGGVKNNGATKDDIYFVVNWISESGDKSGIICSKTAKLDVGESMDCSHWFTMPDENVWVVAVGYHKEGGSWKKDGEDGKWVALTGGPGPGPGPPPSPEFECPPGAICIPNPLTASTFEELVDNIVAFIYKLALLIAPIMFIIAGLAFITAAGDPAKIKQAKDIALWTAIGLMVVLMATGIIKVIQEIFET